MTEQTLKDVSQRNPAEPRPDSDDVFGRMFSRGPHVAADGGERGVAADPEEGAADDDEGAADDDEGADLADGAEAEPRPVAEHRMKDVDQTPPDEDASANRVWERGGEPGVDAEGTGTADESGADGGDHEDDDGEDTVAVAGEASDE